MSDGTVALVCKHWWIGQARDRWNQCYLTWRCGRCGAWWSQTCAPPAQTTGGEDGKEG